MDDLTRDRELAYRSLPVKHLLETIRAPGIDRESAFLILRELESRGVDPARLGLPPMALTDHGMDPGSPGASSEAVPLRSLGSGEIPADLSGSEAQFERVHSSPSYLGTARAANEAGTRVLGPPHPPLWLRRLDLGITVLVFVGILLADPKLLAKPGIYLPLAFSLLLVLGRTFITLHPTDTKTGGPMFPSIGKLISRSSPALITVLLIAAGFSALYQSFSYKPSPEKWPDAFVSSSRETPDSDSNYPRLSRQITMDLASTYGFFVAQDQSLDLIQTVFPDLTPEVARVRFAFDKRFSRSKDRIDEILSEIESGQSFSMRKELQAKANEMIDARFVTRSVANEFLSQVEARSKGEIPSPFLETLLLYHPAYAANPVQEYLDGFGKRYTADGSGKSLGLQISLKFPTSWSDTEGERPHILRKFVDQRKEMAMALIYVQDLGEPPDELAEFDFSDLSEEELTEIVDTTFTSGTMMKNVPLKDPVVHDEGLCSIAGVPSKWVEISGSRQVSDGLWLAQRGVMFYLMYEGRCIGLQFFASDLGTTDKPPDPRPAFDLYGPLFFQMAQSFDVFDRYEP